MRRVFWFIITFLLLAAGCGEDPQHLLQQAQVALDNGRADMALAKSIQVLEDDPGNADALLIKTEALLQQQALSRSRKTIDQLLQQNQQMPETHRLLGEWTLLNLQRVLNDRDIQDEAKRQADYEAALEMARGVLQWMQQHESMVKPALHLHARIAQARAHRLQMLAEQTGADPETDPADLQQQINAEIQQAMDHYRRLLKLEPNHRQAALTYTHLLIEYQRWEPLWKQAEAWADRNDLRIQVVYDVVTTLMSMPETFRTTEQRVDLASRIRLAVSESDRDSRLWKLTSARLLIARQKSDQAQLLLKQVHKNHPENREAAYLLAYTYFEAGDYEKARTLLFPLAASMRNSPRVASLYGRTLLRSNDPAAAAQALAHALQLEPSDELAFIEWVQALAQLGQLDDAESEIEQYHRHRPNDPLAVAFMLQLERYRGRRQSVEQLASQLEQHQPLEDVHLAALIDAHQFLGQLEKVEKYTATLAKRHPNALEGQIALARTLLAQQRGKEVEQMLEALLESHPDSLAIKFHLAQAHMQTRRLDRAAKLLGQLEQAQPNNPAVHLALARSLAGLGRTEESLTHIQLLLDADPSNVAAHELAIRIYRLIRRPDKIAWHLHQVDSDRLDPRRQPVLAAQFKLALGQKEQAAEICRLAIEAGDRDGLLRLILSAIEERNNNSKEALAHLIEMVKAEPDTTEAYHYLRLFFTRHRQVEQGLTVFKQLESRNRTLARLSQGELLQADGRLEEAISLFQAALNEQIEQEGPLAITIAADLAESHRQLGQIDEALGVYERMAEAGRDNQLTQLAQIELLMGVENYDAARSRLEKLAAEIDPTGNHNRTQEVIGLFTRLAQRDLAINWLDKWITDQPRMAELHSARGVLLAQLNRSDAALAALQESVRLAPENAPMRKLLAQLHERRYEFANAEQVLLQRASLGPQAEMVLIRELGEMYLRVGLEAKAAATYDRLRRMAPPRDPHVLLDLATAYLNMNQGDDAYQRLEEILAFAPQYATAQVMLANLDLRRGLTDRAGRRIDQFIGRPAAAPLAISMMTNLSWQNPAELALWQHYDRGIDLEQWNPGERLRWLMARVLMHGQMGQWEEARNAAEMMAGIGAESHRLAMIRFVLNVKTDRMDAAQKIPARSDQFPPAASQLMAMLTGQPNTASDNWQLGRFVAAMVNGNQAAARSAAQSLEDHRTIYRSDLLESLGNASEAMEEAHRQLALALLAIECQLPQWASRICSEVIEAQPRAALAYGLGSSVRLEVAGSAMLPIGVAMHESAMRAGQSGDAASAVTNLETLLAREPDNKELVYALAQACERAQDFDRALGLYEQVWSSSGAKRFVAGNDLAHMIADHRTDRLAEADQIARTVATAMPGSPLHEYLLDTLGWIEHRHGDQEAALGLLNQAVVALRGRHEVHEHLAAVYQAMGNRTWATYHLDQSRINKSPLTAEVSEQ